MKFLNIVILFTDIFTDDTLNTSIFAGLETPLQTVYMGGSEPINACRMLIQAGCDINHENRVGNTPLQVALDKQSCDIAVMLLRADCSLNSQGWFTMDNDCFLISRDNDCPELYELFEAKLKNPVPLLNMCRLRLHTLLTHTWPYKKNIRMLPLPGLLKQFLLFDDIG